MESEMTLERACKRIEELELENALLREELEFFKDMKPSGRKKHDAKWQASYDEFVRLYEKGLTMVEIIEKSECSRRTCYRYKAYYDKLNEMNQAGNEKLDLYCAISEGYKAMQDGRVSTIDEVRTRVKKRREQNS